MNFQITLVGINHRTASVNIRERFALTNCCTAEKWPLPTAGPFNESLILSTCNRVELLAIAEKACEDALLGSWANACDGALDDLTTHAYVFHDLEAVRHVFEVASSLDSMVLGEPQILGQLKSAYRKAVESRNAGPIINRLMHKAFSVAKRVRHETAVAASAVSISYAAVELAKRIFGQMPSHRAMLIGAGEMAELAAMHLLQAGMEQMIVANRTLERAEELARRFRGVAIPFDRLTENLALVDIVISSTGSPQPMLGVEHISQALKKRKNRPMFLIDIAVPRDIEPAVNNLDNVYLYDIDDLREVVEENRHARQEEAEQARLIIAEELEYFGQWLRNLDAKPTILDIINRGEEAARCELSRALRRLGPVNEETRVVMERMALAIARKLNHEPIMYLKNGGMGRDAPHDRISYVRRLLNLDANKD